VQLVPLAQAGEGQQAQSRVPLPFECHRARWTGHDLGRQEIECAACHALHWREELPKQKRRNPGEATFESCCKHGRVVIERRCPLPEPLNALMSGLDPEGRSFREHFRQWNSLFAFSSMLYHMDNRTCEIGGTFQLFQIHGALYDSQGPLRPAGGLGDVWYSQVYLYDPADAARKRSRRALNLDANLIGSGTIMLQEFNPLIQLYLTANERLAEIRGAEAKYHLILNPQLSLVLERGADR